VSWVNLRIGLFPLITGNYPNPAQHPPTGALPTSPKRANKLQWSSSRRSSQLWPSRNPSGLQGPSRTVHAGPSWCTYNADSYRSFPVFRRGRQCQRRSPGMRAWPGLP